MTKNVLILGASGTVGSAVFRELSRCDELKVTGTFFRAGVRQDASMLRFSLEFSEKMISILNRLCPDIVISCLCGDFERQLYFHGLLADWLVKNHGKIIYISTGNVFDGSLERAHYEKEERMSVSDYGRFKIRCEDLLRGKLKDRAVLLRLPFVWGQDSPRLRAVKMGCEAGRLEVYRGLRSNHVADLQIAGLIAWIIREEQEGIFHVGTSDVTDYKDFMERLVESLGLDPPEYVPEDAPGVMAVLSSRREIPERLCWDSGRLIRYLSGRKGE